jgi:hypothetical protein
MKRKDEVEKTEREKGSTLKEGSSGVMSSTGRSVARETYVIVEFRLIAVLI